MQNGIHWLVTHGVWLLGQADGAIPAEGADPVDAAPAADVNPFVLFFMNPINLVLLSAILFMFIVVRPQQRQMKELRKQLEDLKKNDRIVTASGVHGVVVSMGDDVVTVRIDENSGARMTINRDSIAKVSRADSSKR